MRNKTIVIGSGRLGANIAQHLSVLKENVDIIDLHDESFRKLSDEFTGNVVLGDATDLSLLEDVGIKKANRVVITTADDNTNIYLAHISRMFYDVPKVYVRLYDISKGTLIADEGIKPIYPFILSLSEFFKLEKDEVTEE